MFEEVLPVLERPQLNLPFFMLQLSIRELEIRDEVIEGLKHLLDRQGNHCPVLDTQTVKVSAMERDEEKNSFRQHVPTEACDHVTD